MSGHAVPAQVWQSDDPIVARNSRCPTFPCSMARVVPLLRANTEFAEQKRIRRSGRGAIDKDHSGSDDLQDLFVNGPAHVCVFKKPAGLCISAPDEDKVGSGDQTRMKAEGGHQPDYPTLQGIWPAPDRIEVAVRRVRRQRVEAGANSHHVRVCRAASRIVAEDIQAPRLKGLDPAVQHLPTLATD